MQLKSFFFFCEQLHVKPQSLINGPDLKNFFTLVQITLLPHLFLTTNLNTLSATARMVLVSVILNCQIFVYTFLSECSTFPNNAELKIVPRILLSLHMAAKTEDSISMLRTPAAYASDR